MRIVIIIALLLVSDLGSSGAIPIYVEGRIDGINSFRYETWVEGEQWKIKIHYGSEGHFDVVGYDGVNVYSYLRHDDYPGYGERETVDKMLSGDIVGGALPLKHNLWVFFPWFAFCSGSYLQNLEKGQPIPPPWSAPRTRTASGITAAEFTTFSSGLRVPRSADFFVTAESKRQLSDIDWMNDPHAAEVRANEYPDDFYAGSYQVIETVELEGIQIPSRIEVKRFVLLTTGAVAETRFIVTVDNFRREELESYQPEIPEGFSVSVRDWRLRDVSVGLPHISYSVEEGVWPVSPPPDAVARFESERVLRAEVRGDPSVQPKVLIIFLVLLIGVPAIVLLLMKKRGHDVWRST